MDEFIDIAALRVGQKVRYQPAHFLPMEAVNGIVKEIRDDVEDAVWVVYHCNGEWDKYKEYTSAKTNLCDLRLGWKN